MDDKKKRREELLKFFQEAEKDVPASGMLAMWIPPKCQYCGKTDEEIFGDGPYDYTGHTEECKKLHSKP